jgi:hypothetical protein
MPQTTELAMPSHQSPLRQVYFLLLDMLLLIPMGSASTAVSKALRPVRKPSPPATPSAPKRAPEPLDGRIAPTAPRVIDTGEILDLPTTYRSTFTMSAPYAHRRLKHLGVQIPREEENPAMVLATEQELEALARLRFQPIKSDSLADLAQAPGLRLEKEIPLSRLDLLASPDDDGDGLTNTEKEWWGTDPLNQDSDGDLPTDKAEVDDLLDWLGNRLADPPVAGKPSQGRPPETTSPGYPTGSSPCPTMTGAAFPTWPTDGHWA